MPSNLRSNSQSVPVKRSWVRVAAIGSTHLGTWSRVTPNAGLLVVPVTVGRRPDAAVTFVTVPSPRREKSRRDDRQQDDHGQGARSPYLPASFALLVLAVLLRALLAFFPFAGHGAFVRAVAATCRGR